MPRRPVSHALPCLALLFVLVVGFANLSVGVHAGSSSDLTVDGVWLEDASQVGQPITQLSPGQSFNIIATIKNIGSETASGYYVDVYYDSDYGRGGPDNITAGEVQTWYVGPLTAQAGTHTAKWVVDPDNQIAELNETNNQRQLVFTLGSQTVTTTATTSTSPTTQLSSTSTSPLPVTHALGWLPDSIPDNVRVTPIVSAALPTHLDWTQKDGQNWMTSVKNQGGCGSCVAFAAVGATEGQYKIAYNSPAWNLDLSEQHLFSCGGGSCSGGWYISAALNYLQQYGTPDEACSPYQGLSGSSSCSNSCPDWQSRAYKISGWSWITSNPSAVEAALMSGPLVAGFTVYADFYTGYSSGVYHWDHVSQAVGGHAIVIVGYDQPGQYWIVKNSWGSGWGENGYFRIGFGEAGIESSVAQIAVTPQTATTVTATIPVIQTATSLAYVTTTRTVTSYTGTSTLTSTVPTVTTVVLVPLAMASTVRSTQLLTSITTTTVTSYTGTRTLTSTIVVPTTVTLAEAPLTSTVQTTQFLTSVGTTTVTGYTTLTVGSYTATTTLRSTSVVYTTVTASGVAAVAGSSSPLVYFGFLSLLAVTIGHGAATGGGLTVTRARSRTKRRCSKN